MTGSSEAFTLRAAAAQIFGFGNVSRPDGRFERSAPPADTPDPAEAEEVRSRSPSIGHSDRVLTLKEAALYAGRAPSTLRGWIRAGKLLATREGDHRSSALGVRHGDLVACMQERGLIDRQPRGRGSAAGSGASLSHSKDTELSMAKALIEQLSLERDRLLVELERERAYLRRELAETQDRLGEERDLNRSLSERMMALERENTGLGGTGHGVLGYLGSRVMGLVSDARRLGR